MPPRGSGFLTRRVAEARKRGVNPQRFTSRGYSQQPGEKPAGGGGRTRVSLADIARRCRQRRTPLDRSSGRRRRRSVPALRTVRRARQGRPNSYLRENACAPRTPTPCCTGHTKSDWRSSLRQPARRSGYPVRLKSRVFDACSGRSALPAGVKVVFDGLTALAARPHTSEEYDQVKYPTSLKLRRTSSKRKQSPTANNFTDYNTPEAFGLRPHLRP